MKTSHGADINQTKKKYNLNHIDDYSSNVNIFHSNLIYDIHKNINLQELSVYPDIEYTNLREKLGSKYDIPINNIIVGNGSTELIFLIMALDSIQKVGILHPTFSEYERAARLSQKEVVDLFYIEDFKIDINCINCEDLDILFVCNPNNPSGNINDLSALAKKCKENNTILFVDETFMDFTGKNEQSLLPLAKERDNIFVLKAVTKFYALTGVRLGYGFSSCKIIEELWKKKEPWTINLFAEKFVDVIFDEVFEEKTVNFFEEEILWYKNELDKLDKLKVYDSDANYFLIKLYTESAKELKEKMIREHGILIRDCSNFKGLDESFFRINIKGREGNTKLLNALKKELEYNE